MTDHDNPRHRPTPDRILDLIDAGLQSSPEPSYSTDRQPSACARCQHHPPADNGDICQPCRAFLLEDSDHDPAARPDEQPWLEPSLWERAEQNYRARIVIGDEHVNIESTTLSSASAVQATSVLGFALQHDPGWTLTRAPRQLTTIECLVCGSPVTGVTREHLPNMPYVTLEQGRRILPTSAITVTPCEHTDRDNIAGLAVALLRNHPLDSIGAIIWWAHLWAKHWRTGGQPRNRPDLPRLIDVTAETGKVTLIDERGHPIDRVTFTPPPGDDRLLRALPRDVLADIHQTDTPATFHLERNYELYRLVYGDIYQREESHVVAYDDPEETR